MEVYTTLGGIHADLNNLEDEVNLIFTSCRIGAHRHTNDILNHLKEDSACLTATMVDYYALSQSGGWGRAWSGKKTTVNFLFEQKAAMIEKALLADICEKMGEGFNPNRF